MPHKGAPGGAPLEVRLNDGEWYSGRLLERVPRTDPPRWRVQFDDGERRDDAWLANPNSPVLVGGARVEVEFDGTWYGGMLVQLVRESELWGVAFDNGDWAEDVRLGDPDARYVLSGRVCPKSPDFGGGGDGGWKRKGGGDGGETGERVGGKVPERGPAAGEIVTRENVLAVLTVAPTAAREVASLLGIHKKMANSFLYSLEHAGKAARSTKGSGPPLWAIVWW